MSNRIVATAAAAAFAAYAAAALITITPTAALAQDVPATAAPAPAKDGSVWGSGSVGAMHFEVGNIATSKDEVLRQSRGLVTAVPANFAPAQQPKS